MRRTWISTIALTLAMSILLGTTGGFALASEELPEEVLESMEPEMLSFFEEVYELNPEIVGYLKFGDGREEFVTRTEDNEFYLTHDYLTEESSAGSAFVDVRCQLDPEDPDRHLMIHGHNMRDGSIFGTLGDYREIEFLKEHPLIEYSTLYEEKIYVPYALFDASMNEGNAEFFKIDLFEFDDDEEFMEHVNNIREWSIVEIPIEIDETDEILTLVTCSYSQDNGRFLLCLRELREDETPEEMAELVQLAELKSEM